MINILFFASLRDQLNCEQMTLDVSSPTTVDDVIKQLKAQGEGWAEAFSKSKILSAVNQQIVGGAHTIQQHDEVAFFPPVTGG